MNKKKFLDVIKIVYVIAVVGGGIYYVIKNYSTAIQYLSSISIAKLLISFILIVIMRILNVDLVQRSLILIDWKPDFKQAFSFVSISQLGKYIPGGVWQFVARFGAYKENNITYKDMGKSFIVENIWMVAGSFLVSLFFIFISHPTTILQKYGAELSVTIQMIIGGVCLVFWFLTLVIIEIIFKSKTRKPSLINVCKQFISQTAMWVTLGASLFCLFDQPISFNNLFFTIGAFGLSFLIGYVAIFAPGGIGVREYIAVLLFSVMFSSTEIGIYTIVNRLLYTLAEFLLAGIALLLNPKKQHPQDQLQRKALSE